MSMAMDSKQCASFLFVFLLAAFSTARPATLADPSSEKVSLALYYETLCPGCSEFIIKYLNKLVKDDEMMDIVDLRLVPFGNAIIKKSSGSIECQHGPKECLFNTMDACVIDAVPSVKEHFPFIHCLEKLLAKEEYGKVGKCFGKLPRVDLEAIVNCTNGERGLELEMKYGMETESLQPPHEFVPWVTVNGAPLYDDFENFIAVICEAYRGPNVPKICSPVSLKSTQAGVQNAELRGCRRSEMAKATATNVKPTTPWRIGN